MKVADVIAEPLLCNLSSLVDFNTDKLGDEALILSHAPALYHAADSDV